MVLDRLQEEHREFHEGICIEGGSKNWNGSARDFLGPNVTYIGIDKGATPSHNKDVTWDGYIHEYPGGDNQADLVVCLNVFERDYHWRESSTRLLQLLKPGGLFVFNLCSFGDNGIGESWAETVDGKPFYKQWDNHQEMIEHLSKEFIFKLLEVIKTGNKSLMCNRRGNPPVRVESYQFNCSRTFTYLVGRKV